MNKIRALFLKIIVGYTAFAVGIIGAVALSRVVPPHVTMCQLAQNQWYYRGMTVVVDTQGHGYMGSLLISDAACKSPDAAAVVSTDNGVYTPPGELKQLFHESVIESYEADVSITGRFDPEALLGCFGPKAAIYPVDIQLRSPIEAKPVEYAIAREKRTEAARKVFAEFQRAMERKDMKKIASMISFPLRISDSEGDGTIGDAQVFVKMYKYHFPPSVTGYIVKIDPESIHEDGNLMLTRTYEIEMSASCNHYDDETCNRDFKISTISLFDIISKYENK